MISKLKKLLPDSLIAKLRGNKFAIWLYWWLNHGLKICGGGGVLLRLHCRFENLGSLKVTTHAKKIKQTRIVNHSCNNEIIIGNATLRNVVIRFGGGSNKLIIHDGALLRDASIFMTESDNLIEIGENFDGGAGLSIFAQEGTKVRIGNNVMFSQNVEIMTSDSHSILSNGERINPAADIIIGDRVWFGRSVLCLKGTNIGNDTIVGARSIMTAGIYESNCIYAGTPAKKIKENISWAVERIENADCTDP